MALLNILKEGEEALRKKSRPLDKITERTCTLLDDMLETMRNADGVGLAAPQVGVLRRVVLVETDETGLLEFINPVIVEREGEQEELEGCLSIPGKWGYTHRPMKVTVRALDRNGNEFTVTGEGLCARAFCHEIDHLDGTLFTDNAVRMLSPEEIEEIE